MKRIIYAGCLLCMLAACSKDKVQELSAGETNRLTYVIADNFFNFSTFNAAIRRTGFETKLADPGPYTVLLPDNNAFQSAGYADANTINKESMSVLQPMISYHILTGVWELNKLPFSFNQELTTTAGTKMYITRWVKNRDTILTVNGSRITTYNLPASNGLIQVMNTVLQPLVFNNLSDAVAGDTSLTFLNMALQQAGMKNMLAGKDPYTIFAPTNNAFRAIGFPTTDSVGATDPDVLKKMLYYTVFNGRKFIYDYILTTDNTEQTEQAMLNGKNVIGRLQKSGVQYTSVSLKGSGNTSVVNIQKANRLTGNGVLHIVDQLLKENQ